MTFRKYSGFDKNTTSRVSTDGNGRVIKRPTPEFSEENTVKVNVGATTTGEPETNASVTNSGTETDVVLNFTIPRGKDGQDGDDGNNATEPSFTVHAESGSDAAAYISGSPPNWLISLVLPRGEKGDKGDVGDPTLEGPMGPAGPAGPPGTCEFDHSQFITEAPSDGQPYVRYMNAWYPLSNFVS